jgi:heme-degrading monooxygenase HmoA
MITISRDSGIVTVINVFSCEPSQQDALIKAWQDAPAELGKLPGAVSAALHKSLDGTRVVNYVQMRSMEDWENLRKVGQSKGYFDRIMQFGKPDPHLYEIVDTREGSTVR